MSIKRKVILNDKEFEAIKSVFESGQYVKGPKAKELEAKFAEYCDTKYAISVNSGTAALYLIFRAMGIGSGDEVITAANSFIASANSIEMTGAKAVFVDTDKETFNIDISKVESAITDRTKAILPIHLYGKPVEIDELRKIVGDIPIIEDSCQAHGAQYNSKMIGSIGNASAFSFFPTKNMNVAGDGGIITTDDEELYEKMILLRDNGRNNEGKFVGVGLNFRLSEIQAAVGCVQTEKLDGFNANRIKIAQWYDELLQGNNNIILPRKDSNEKHVYHHYVIKTSQRDQLMSYLKENQIFCGIHYKNPIHLFKYYQEKYSYKKGDFPVSERLSDEILSLPIYPQMEYSDVEKVSQKINDFFKE